MAKLIDEFRRGWQGISQPSRLFGIGFAACCLALSTAARWGLSLIRPDVFFTPYFPAVFFATAFGGFRIGVATALVGGPFGVIVNFGDMSVDFARLALAGDLSAGVRPDDLGRRALSIGRGAAAPDLKAPDRGGGISQARGRRIAAPPEKQIVDIHAVLHQVLQDQPEIWASIDPRMRALSATDDLIARVDGSGCDIKDLLLSELGPYGHVRFTLNGNPLFLPAKLAVSLALMFHELATNAGKYGAFSSARGLLQVSWSVSDDRLNIVWDETEGPAVGAIGHAGFGTKLLKSALLPFDGKTEISFLKTGVHCTMQCRLPARLSRLAAMSAVTAMGVDRLLMTIGATPIQNARPTAVALFSRYRLNQNYKGVRQVRSSMQSRHLLPARPPRSKANPTSLPIASRAFSTTSSGCCPTASRSRTSRAASC